MRSGAVSGHVAGVETWPCGEGKAIFLVGGRFEGDLARKEIDSKKSECEVWEDRLSQLQMAFSPAVRLLSLFISVFLFPPYLSLHV